MKNSLPICTVGYLFDHASLHVGLGRKSPTPKAVKRKIAGFWLGFGGDVEESDTSIRQSFSRELGQESEFSASSHHMEVVAKILIRDENGDRLVLYYLLVHEWQGSFLPTREFDAFEWFSIANLPEKLLGADKLILPRIFAGEKLKGFVEYDPEMNVVDHSLHATDIIE